MYRGHSNGNQILRRFVQQAESYNRCMFPKNSSISRNQSGDNHVTEQILFCQNQIDHLNISSSTFKKQSNEILIVDLVSNGYKYQTSSFELNILQQCSIISIISPHAFTIQLSKDLITYDVFFKDMNGYYNSIDDLSISRDDLRKNLLCVTWDENTFTWNRSQILEYDLLDDTVNVFFVDFNSWEEHVSRSRLRFILTKYSSRPVDLLTCRLASISPLTVDKQWNDVTSKTFQNVVQKCQCDVELLYKGRDNTFYVNLFATHEEAYVCINDFLIHCKMAKPMNDISNEKNLVYLLDDDGQPMHSMIALYWKAGEAMRETCLQKEDEDQRSLVCIKSAQTKDSLLNTPLTKVVMMNEHDQMIFVRYNSYIMVAWFTISHILNESDPQTITHLANQIGFKAILIDPLSHPLLSSELIKLIPLPVRSNELRLYSIDCVRKIFRIYQFKGTDVYHLLDRARLAETNGDISFWTKPYEIDDLIVMWSNARSYSNPIYDLIDQTNHSFTRPLMIDIQPICSYTCTNTNQIPLLLLANCLTSPSPPDQQHNYVNQRIDEENFDPLYAKPRKRCVTLSDEPFIIPPKTSRFSLNSIKPERAQLISTVLPAVTVLSSDEPIDEIDQFIARENDRVERVKLRRRQQKPPTMIEQPKRPPPAFSNPNYIDIPTVHDHEEKKLSKSILV